MALNRQRLMELGAQARLRELETEMGEIRSTFKLGQAASRRRSKKKNSAQSERMKAWWRAKKLAEPGKKTTKKAAK
jgi:hypothetical protein